MPHKSAPRILVHYDRPEPLRERIAERFPDADIACCDTYAGLPGALKTFAPEILFCIKFENRPYPRSHVMASPTITWVSNGGAGVDHLVPWDPGRLTVTHASGVASAMMAEYVIGGMLALAIGLPGFLRRQMAREWRFEQVSGIAGATVAIIGLGRTGQAVARLASAHGMRVLGTRAHPVETAGVDTVLAPDRLHEALAIGDYVVVTAPLLPSTRHLVDAAAISDMKPGARLVDVSRGGVVDQSALVHGLASGKLAGAVLDVFEREPLPVESPLWSMENVIITPHCSSVYAGWELRAVDMFCDNLARREAGEDLENVVNPARGY